MVGASAVVALSLAASETRGFQCKLFVPRRGCLRKAATEPVLAAGSVVLLLSATVNLAEAAKRGGTKPSMAPATDRAAA
jgi:hypothetical protein